MEYTAFRYDPHLNSFIKISKSQIKLNVKRFSGFTFIRHKRGQKKENQYKLSDQ